MSSTGPQGISRFSSRRKRLTGMLPELLQGATSYDRIAGYFSSSMLEVAGEAIDKMAEGSVVRVVCNSELMPADVITIQSGTRAANLSMQEEWASNLPPGVSPGMRDRLQRLYQFLKDGKLLIKVIPDEVFGLIHGKAGVITRADGSKIGMIGSVNESRRAWKQNYELLYLDESPEGIEWISDEFEQLWNNASASFELAPSVIDEIGRLSKRVVVHTIPEWKALSENPASVAVELPVYRKSNGLWPHQKYFVDLAFRHHREHGARFVLADQVGLGKTLQLGLVAKLIALSGTKPILILAPKPLLEQWQNEMWSMLAFPIARWDGRRWIDEQGVEYPATGPTGIKKCPRRAGIVSAGLVTANSQSAEILRDMSWDCVILDEAHKARRKNLKPEQRGDPADSNNLLTFMRAVAANSRSVLLATATPVQLDPIEAWDLLDVLAAGNDFVMGDSYSAWRNQVPRMINYIMGDLDAPHEPVDLWEPWIRNPLPPVDEPDTTDFKAIRMRLGMSDSDYVAPGDAWYKLSPAQKARIGNLRSKFFQGHNPILRFIVRRTREWLQEEIDPTTGEAYLPRIDLVLHGEKDEDALELPPYLEEAFTHAEAFCEELGKRENFSSGFMQTLLLRRVGSSIIAGKRTAEKMLGGVLSDDSEETTEDEEPEQTSKLYPLKDAERMHLEGFLECLIQAEKINTDPKLVEVRKYLKDRGWKRLGCILFSQYFDTAEWVARKLSEDYPNEIVGLYAGANRSRIYTGGEYETKKRDQIKNMVQSGEITLLVGTDAASEGLNLQRLGTLINIDLPWNPTRLEQRKGRIVRIGQPRDSVDLLNLRYRGSVEDRVHRVLAQRLQNIHSIFGQIPDTLEDIWIMVAKNNDAAAYQKIATVPEVHPFEFRWERIEAVNWETCYQVLEEGGQLNELRKSWK
jgi:superfamily II DNA or RNA helicase